MEEAKVALSMHSSISLSGTIHRHHAIDFTVGDSVLLSMHHIDLKGNHKFKPCFIGPFLVVQKVGSQAY